MLHNYAFGITYIAGFGVENAGLAYSTRTSAAHRAPRKTTTSSGGQIAASLSSDLTSSTGNSMVGLLLDYEI